LPNWPAYQIVPSARLDRIARALAEPRHDPFLERDLEFSGHEFRRALGVRRELRGEIVEDFVLRRFVVREVDHVADELFPVLARITRTVADQVRRVACRAETLDELPALAIGKWRRAFGGGRLCLHAKGNQRYGDDRNCASDSNHDATPGSNRSHQYPMLARENKWYWRAS
jgi:hypothetical protein